jgi:AsmA-like C-terminal region
MCSATHFWNRCRIGFRWCRIGVWLLILVLVCAIVYLDVIGLPGFVKRPLIDALRQRGLVVQFVRLRLKLSPGGGLIADNVHLGGEAPDSPTFTVQELHLQINYGALLHRKWQLDGVMMRHGKFILPVSASNEPPCSLVFDHLQTELRFQTNDVWTLDNFQADFAGAKFVLSGQVSHASAVRDWGIFQGRRGVRGAAPSQLKKIGLALSRIYFNKTSQLTLNVQGDATNINSFFVFLAVDAPGVHTPWGSIQQFNLVAHTIGSTTPTANPGDVSPLEIDWKAQLSKLKTDMAEVDYVYCDGSWRATGEIDSQVRVARLKSKKLDADFISCGGFWRAPEVEVTNVFARLGGGQLQAAARFNVNTHEFSFTNSSCFNLQAINALLTEKTRESLGQLTLPEPPQLAASGSMILPERFDVTPDYWRTNVQPTIRLNGEVAATNLEFSHLSLDELHTHFSYSNEIWALPDTRITLAEGRLQTSGIKNDETKEYHFHIHGAISPEIIYPFLPPKAARGFHDFTFKQPAFLDAEIHGRLYDYDSITANGHAALTNFVLHGEPVDNVETDFRYAHRAVDFFAPHLQAPGGENMHADGVRLDWPGDRIYFTNGLGTADPQKIAIAIGPVPAQVMKPYHFLALPTATVNGYAPLRDPTNADLDFKTVIPAQVECLKLKTRALTGEIHWLGQTLILTNFASTNLYEGNGSGNAVFNFQPRNGANFTFIVSVQNVNLHLLAQDLSSPSNHLEHLDGALKGRFIVTSGNSEDWRSCNGYGDVDLNNGLLWDVPLFGAISPVLNNIYPGMGNSKATDASAQFFMTNGVIATSNLQIHTLLMELHGDGTVDLKGNLNTHFSADLLRGVPGLGPLFSVITSPFAKVLECKVGGTWEKPKIRPVYLYVPMKVLFFMTHPFHSLQDLFPADKPNTAPKN